MKNMARCLAFVFVFSSLDSFFIKSALAAKENDEDLLKENEHSNNSLLDFKATYNGNFTLLEWRVSGKSNISMYIIEMSNDEEIYEELSEVKSLKLSNESKNYNFLDNNNLLEDKFYRLRMIDYDGMVSFSPVVMVKVNPLNQLRLFPVPTKNILNIKGYFGKSADIEIKKSDLNGTNFPVYNKNKIAEDHYTIDLSSLKPNNNLIKISCNGKNASFRILKL
jgi:hypothetical protein